MTGEPQAARPDPGAVRARTLLAWVRTTLSFAGCTVLLARLVQLRHPAATATTTLLGIAVAAGLASGAVARYRAAGRPAGSVAAPLLVCAAAAAALALAGVAVLAVLSS